MSTLIEETGRRLLRRKAVAWARYMQLLTSPMGEASDEDVTDLCNCMQLAGIPWGDVVSDFSAKAERAKWERIVSENEAVIEREGKAHADAHQQWQKLIDTHQAGQHAVAPLSKTMAEAEAAMKNARAHIDRAEQRLRQLRTDFPRVWGVEPEITL